MFFTGGAGATGAANGGAGGEGGASGSGAGGAGGAGGARFGTGAGKKANCKLQFAILSLIYTTCAVF